MNLGSHSFRTLLLAGVLALSLAGIACELLLYRPLRRRGGSTIRIGQ